MSVREKLHVISFEEANQKIRVFATLFSFAPQEALDVVVLLRSLYPNWVEFTYELRGLKGTALQLPEDDESPEYRAALRERFTTPTWIHPGMRLTALERATGKKTPILLRPIEEIAAACGYTGPV